MKKSVQKIKAWSRPKKVALGVGAFIVLAVAASGGSHNQTNLNSTPASNKSSSQIQSQPTVTTKTETETQTIPYDSTTVNNSSMDKGTTKITTAGVNDSKTLTYKVTYTDGKQTVKQLINTTVTAQPVTQVTAIGTYVAPSPAPTSMRCTPLTNGGNCYEPGEYCRNSDHGTSGVAGNGEKIACLDNNGWRWEPS